MPNTLTISKTTGSFQTAAGFFEVAGTLARLDTSAPVSGQLDKEAQFEVTWFTSYNGFKPRR